VLKSAGDGEVGLLAGGGCARRGKRQRSDVGKDGKIYDVSLELYIYSGITLYTTLGS